MGHNRGEETQQAVATCYRRTPENSGNVPNPPKLEPLTPVSKVSRRRVPLYEHPLWSSVLILSSSDERSALGQSDEGDA